MRSWVERRAAARDNALSRIARQSIDQRCMQLFFFEHNSRVQDQCYAKIFTIVPFFIWILSYWQHATRTHKRVMDMSLLHDVIVSVVLVGMCVSKRVNVYIVCLVLNEYHVCVLISLFLYSMVWWFARWQWAMMIMIMICDAFIVFIAAPWRRLRSNIKLTKYGKCIRSNSNNYYQSLNTILIRQYCRVDLNNNRLCVYILLLVHRAKWSCQWIRDTVFVNTYCYH